MNKPDMTPRVLVVQPDVADPLDRFEAWLQQCGIEVETVRPYAGDVVPRTLAADGLIVLGGKMSSNDDADHPWLEDIRALQRDAVAQERPLLGICLGGQLLAQAMGGKVVPGPQGVEAGLVLVEALEASGGDMLFDGLGPRFSVASMHGDMIDALPDESVLLGSSADYPHQAFRAAPRAWGVQFHPEIAPATYEVWAGIFESSDPEQVRRVADGVGQLAAADHAVRKTSALLATRFAGLVGEAARNGSSSG